MGVILSFREGGWPVIVGALFALILVIAFFLSHEQRVAIASSGATISVNAQRWKLQEVRDLIDQIEAAKNVRHVFVRSQPPPLPTP